MEAVYYRPHHSTAADIYGWSIKDLSTDRFVASAAFERIDMKPDGSYIGIQEDLKVGQFILSEKGL